jgi:hypothetical protein
VTRSMSRRTLVRGLGGLSAAAAFAGSPFGLQAQSGSAYPNPYPQDITVFFVGPWLFFAQAPDRPDSMLAVTCDDAMHVYGQGRYAGSRPTGALPIGECTVGVSSSTSGPAAPAGLFASHNRDILCIDNGSGVVAPALAGIPGLRKVYLPVPDQIIPALFVAGSAATGTPPLFQWPGKPQTQVLPSRAATALILRYSYAASLSIDGEAAASRGEHYHFETRVGMRPASPAAEEAHAVNFSKKLAALLTFAGQPLDLSFDPGLQASLVLGVNGIDPAEVGVKDMAAVRPMQWERGLNRPMLRRVGYDAGDCSGAAMIVGKSVAVGMATA